MVVFAMHKTMYLDMFSCEAKKNVQTIVSAEMTQKCTMFPISGEIFLQTGA